MNLESIELKYVGRFRGAATLGPLERGINVLVGPNERGKTTLLRAAARALFDKHTCADDEIRSLQPAGSDLGPSVAVIFHWGNARYRIEKRFLKNPESKLSQWRGDGWHLLADGDAADDRLQKLLQSSVPGRGATKAAHWGSLGFLWARQGEPSDWPSWQGDAGQMVQSRLAKVEIDGLVEKLRKALWNDYIELFTLTGKPKAHGPLERAEKEWVELQKELETIRDRQKQFDELERRFFEHGPELSRLESAVKALQMEATQAEANWRDNEALQQELRARQAVLDSASAKLTDISRDAKQLNDLRRCLQTTEQALTSAATAEKAAGNNEEIAKARVLAAQQILDQSSAKLSALTAQVQRFADLQKLKRLEIDWNAAEQQFRRARNQAKVISDLKAELDKLSKITPAKAAKLQELEQRIHDNSTRLTARGLMLEVLADSEATIHVECDGVTDNIRLKAGTPHMFHAAQSAELQLGEWGKLKVRSGATELELLQTALNHDREGLRRLLVEIGSTTLEEAQETVAHWRTLQTDCQSAESKFQELLGRFDSFQPLEQNSRRLDAQVQALRERLNLTAEEHARLSAELDAESDRLSLHLKEHQASHATATDELKRLRNSAEEQTRLRHQAENQRITLSAEFASLQRQIASLEARYASGIDPAKTAAQTAFVQAEAYRDEVRKKLPIDLEASPELARKAAKALGEARTELERRRREYSQIEGALQTYGAEGLYSKESILLERVQVLQTAIEGFRTRGWAARLVHDLLELRRQAATRILLGPLEQRLTSAFANVTGVPDRRVFLDDQLQIRGVGVNEDALVHYGSLSQGAKEQLLLCLRLAVADELARHGHSLVILDDVLVNTDIQRQQRVLDLLRGAADTLQILILTCHSERYKDVGQPVAIRQDDMN